MTLVVDSRGRPDLDHIGLNRVAASPTNFVAGKPSWVTEAGTVTYNPPTTSAPYAQVATGAVSGDMAELVGPQCRMSFQRGLWLTVGGWHGGPSTGTSDFSLGMGFYGAADADGGVRLFEDGTTADGPVLEVRRSGGVGTVKIPVREQLVGASEWKRRRVLTMLLYRLADETSTVWHCALLDGGLTDGHVIADEPIYSGNPRNTAAVVDIGAVFPRVRVTTREAASRYFRLRRFEYGFIDW